MENPQNALVDLPENQPAAAIARFHLPDEWSGKGACPVCRTPGQLSVMHEDITPDRMVCGACGTAFEVETAGMRIRLATAPPALADRTAGLLDAWLTPAELLLLVERPAGTTAGSPFEPLPATMASGGSSPAAAPALVSAAKAPTAPLSARSAGVELEPGSEDWFASLAAVIGGQLPIKPPPDAVLADELERALLNRLEPGANGDAAAAGVVDSGPLPAAPEPTIEPEPLLVAPVPEPLRPAAPKSATAILAEAMAARAAANAPATAAAATPALSSAVAATLTAEPPAAPAPILSAASAVSAAEAARPVEVEDGTALMLAAISADKPYTSHAIPPSASRRELAERAWKLHEMGNSLASIQGALESSGGTPDDVGIIMSKLIALEQARQERFRRTVRRGVIAAVLIVIVLVVIAIVLGSLRPAAAPAGQATVGLSGTPGVGTPAPTEAAAPGYNPIVAFINQLLPGDVKLANGATPTPAASSAVLGVLFPAVATATFSAADRATQAARESGLPGWVATLVPRGLILLNVPTPSIENSGPPNSPCPTTAEQASALFGGPSADWAFNHDQQGWIFILADKASNIRVPANMTAGYLVVGQNLEMRSAVGPATLHNVNFVAVSCQ